MSHSLIVLPDDTAKPILEAVSAAKKSLQIRMFLFTDPGLIDAVIAAKHRGVEVRVMLNPARRGGESENDETKAKLDQGGHRSQGQQPRIRSDSSEVDGDR